MSDAVTVALTKEQTKVLYDFVKRNGPFMLSKTPEGMQKSGRETATFSSNSSDRLISGLRDAGVNLPDSRDFTVNVNIDGSPATLLSLTTQNKSLREEGESYAPHAAPSIDVGITTVNIQTLATLCKQHGISGKTTAASL